MAASPPSDSLSAQPLRPMLTMMQRFIRAESFGGILLLIATIAALVWYNSPWAESYESIRDATVTVGAGSFEISKACLLWVNDGLMAIFFLVVGLEIKREVIAGELASVNRAMLPVVAAIGGMVGPALLFVAFTAGTEYVGAWGVPMATDIAFAVGVLALLGKRAPAGIKVFLVAVAIVDDIGAVLVIAIFYTKSISIPALVVAGAVFAVLIVLNRLGVRRLPIYGILGVILWVALLKSGVHATVAGILLASMIPAREKIDTGRFAARLRRDGDLLATTDTTQSQRQSALEDLEVACARSQSPLVRLEHALLPWTTYLIIPVFALFNAGVVINAESVQASLGRMPLGIAIGLIFGNQIGITGATWLIVRFGPGRLPEGVTWRHVHAAACLAGIGFTMSLFIAGLAFDSVEALDQARMGILFGSLVSAAIGIILFRMTPPAE